MKQIPLTKGMFAIVDDEDFDVYSTQKWHVKKGSTKHYAACARKVTHEGKEYSIKIFMHRCMLDADVGVIVDHINGNGLDNRRCNLRLATRSQNLANQRTVRNKWGYKGITYRRRHKTWRARIGFNGKTVDLGEFGNLDDAAQAYDEAAKKLFGEFAVTNEMIRASLPYCHMDTPPGWVLSQPK